MCITVICSHLPQAAGQQAYHFIPAEGENQGCLSKLNTGSAVSGTHEEAGFQPCMCPRLYWDLVHTPLKSLNCSSGNGVSETVGNQALPSQNPDLVTSVRDKKMSSCKTKGSIQLSLRVWNKCKGSNHNTGAMSQCQLLGLSEGISKS